MIRVVHMLITSVNAYMIVLVKCSDIAIYIIIVYVHMEPSCALYVQINCPLLAIYKCVHKFERPAGVHRSML